MLGRDFFDRVTADERFEWLGVREGRTPVEDEVLVGYKKTGLMHIVTTASVLEQPWEELEAFFLGMREPYIMIHMGRIVGYYGQIRNWNKSKLAELRDRGRGNYGVSAQTPNLKVNLPNEITTMVAAGHADRMTCEVGSKS